MKKKGRICGTIGLIISLALAGSTVVYGAMYSKKAIGTQTKAFGSVSTGNIINDYFSNGSEKTGFDKTKALVSDTVKSLTGSPVETYKSYTMNFVVNDVIHAKDTEKESVLNYTIDGNVYFDSNYTYLNVTVKNMANKTFSAEGAEFIRIKETGKVYANKIDARGVNNKDSMGKDVAQWQEKAIPDIFSNIFMELEKAFQSVNNSNTPFIDILTGEYNFKNTKVEEGVTSTCRFTSGYTPTIRCEYEKPVKSGEGFTRTISVSYSNLNNTTVKLPDSLKEAIK